jgi:hypothetical protein
VGEPDQRGDHGEVRAAQSEQGEHSLRPSAAWSRASRAVITIDPTWSSDLLARQLAITLAIESRSPRHPPQNPRGRIPIVAASYEEYGRKLDDFGRHDYTEED